MPRLQPASYSLHIRQRATLEEPLVLKAAGQPMNLTGFTLVASIWRDQRRDEKLADLTVNYVDRAQGQVSLYLSRNQTRGLSGGGYWDLLVIEPSGNADYWLEGPVFIDVGLSDNP